MNDSVDLTKPENPDTDAAEGKPATVFDASGYPIPSREEFLPSPRPQPDPFQRWPLVERVFPALIVTLICFVGTFLDDLSVKPLFSASGTTVWEHREYWRLFSALFIHGDLSHFGFNALSLLFFGWLLYAYFGPLFFPILAIVVGIASNAVAVWWYPPEVSLIGASGMIFGMMSIWLVLYMRFDRGTKPIKKLLRVVGFVFMLVFPHSYEPGTSYIAHASGFVIGVVIGLAGRRFAHLRSQRSSLAS